MNKLYPINESFVTVQGEGYFTGTPAIFIRLQGCNVLCPWCDTKHSWDLDDTTKENDIDKVLNKTGQQDGDKEYMWGNISIQQIKEKILDKYPQIRLVVISGGEPALHDLTALVDLIESTGRIASIETSGTEPVYTTDKTWLTVSPKIKLGTQKPLFKQTIEKASEIKFVCGNDKMLEKLDDMLANYQIDAQIYLQPLSQLAKSTQFCFDTVIKRSWKLSIQTHKYIEVR